MKPGMGDMMRQVQKMQDEMARMQKQLGDKMVSEEAGGGMIRVTANGNKEIVSVEIDPQAINPDEKELLEDLVVAAVNKALEAAKKMEEEEMGKITKGLLPPNMKIPGF